MSFEGHIENGVVVFDQPVAIPEGTPVRVEAISPLRTSPANAAMLQALSQIEEIHKGMNPKKDKKDYLREARSGAMYGFGDAD
jgi:hypothetical protein